MGNFYKILLYISLGILSAVVSCLVSTEIKAATMLSLVDKLISVSSIIFAIMGVWFSVSKVEIEQKVKEASSRGDGTNADKAIERARFLVIPMTTSALALLVSLVFYLFYYLLPFFTLNAETISAIKWISLTSIIFGYLAIAINTVPVFLSGGIFLLDLLNLRSYELKKRNEHGEEIKESDQDF